MCLGKKGAKNEAERQIKKLLNAFMAEQTVRYLDSLSLLKKESHESTKLFLEKMEEEMRQHLRAFVEGRILAVVAEVEELRAQALCWLKEIEKSGVEIAQLKNKLRREAGVDEGTINDGGVLSASTVGGDSQSKLPVNVDGVAYGDGDAHGDDGSVSSNESSDVSGGSEKARGRKKGKTPVSELDGESSSSESVSSGAEEVVTTDGAAGKGKTRKKVNEKSKSVKRAKAASHGKKHPHVAPSSSAIVGGSASAAVPPHVSEAELRRFALSLASDAISAELTSKMEDIAALHNSILLKIPMEASAFEFCVII
jgi:hypothetical protein